MISRISPFSLAFEYLNLNLIFPLERKWNILMLNLPVLRASRLVKWSIWTRLKRMNCMMHDLMLETVMTDLPLINCDDDDLIDMACNGVG